MLPERQRGVDAAPEIRLAVPAPAEPARPRGAAPPVAPLLLTPPEAAKALRIGRRRLWELTKSGAVRAVRIGRSVRYTPAALQAWVDSVAENGYNGPPDTEAGA